MNTTVFSDKALPERVYHTVLPNGLKIYVAEKPEFNSSFAVFGTKYGSIDTCFSQNGGERISVPEGIAHYLEHKLFESEDGDAFSRFSETGASANAFTSFDRTCYLFSCADRFYDNLDILLDFVQSPYFTEQTVRKEQGIIGQEIRMYDDSPAWCVLFGMLEAMYEHHPIKIDIAGTVESIAKIKADLLYSCYGTFYNPANMFVCIAGNVNAEEVIRRVQSAIKPSAPVAINRHQTPEPDGIIKPYTEREMAVAQPIFSLGFKEKCDGERSLFEFICSDMLLAAIAGDNSPLYERLIERGLVNDEFEAEYFQGNGYACPIFQGESRDPQAVAAEITAEIERLKKEGIDQKLFESVRRSLYGSAIKRYNNVESIVMSLVDSAMSEHTPFEDIEILRNVTKEDVEARLSLIKPENAVLSVIKPKA